MKMGIIGAGSMGRWFAEYAKYNGLDVKISDIDPDKAEKAASEIGIDSARSNRDVLRDTDIILIAVPIENTPRVVKEVSSTVKENALIMDIASAKEEVADVMRELDVETELVSIHPLFGPGANNIEGKTILSIPIKSGDKYSFIKEMFEKSGARIEEMGAEEHDKLMTVTQSMTHFILLTYMAALKSMKNFKEAEDLQTPISAHLFDLAKAFLNTNPKVIGDLQIRNRYASIARSSVMEASRSLNTALETKDINVVNELFNEIKELIGNDEIDAAYNKLYKDIEGGES